MALNFVGLKEKAIHYLYTEKNKLTSLLIQAETTTKVKREYIAGGLAGIFSLYMIFGYGAQLLCNLIGYIYPAFCSIKALESHHKGDDTRWLTYWVVFALFSVFEFFSDILLSWFPFYWLAKCVFLVWCFAPGAFNGSDIIYKRIILPFFLKHQNQINSAVGVVTDELENLAENAAKKAAAKYE